MQIGSLPDSNEACDGEADDMLDIGRREASRRALGDPVRREDRELAATLADEDAAEEYAALSPHERATCPVHRRWSYQCVSSPSHAIRVTGHRWCRSCDVALTVAVDELTGSITLDCPLCHRLPNTAANRQIIRSCRASYLARQDRKPRTRHHSPRRAA